PARLRHGLGRPPGPPGARARVRRGAAGCPPLARRGGRPARAESRPRACPPRPRRGPRAVGTVSSLAPGPAIGLGALRPGTLLPPVRGRGTRRRRVPAGARPPAAGLLAELLP